MFKKLLVAAAAAAAVSVPFAGAAWADTTSNGIGAGGVPGHVGDVISEVNPDYNPSGDPMPPGSIASGIAKEDGSTPEAFGGFVNGFWDNVGVDTNYGPTPPGLAVKSFTPGCTHGRQATDADGTIPDGVNECY